ncbi:TolC family protein [Bdellovibrio svalbardensis]|uniref:TolC family protein n=1 Tax=Bdellovibrio svalbardensis TaxID=2972972 RepID=A0ABT6DJ71_9BACT|nr:TolC family protein [Bdellovibrio svalbardensis]MDG0816275.1 TolC family protein [Bdellovibrio svalbardensis]
MVRVLFPLILLTTMNTQAQTVLEWKPLLHKVYGQNSEILSLQKQKDSAYYQKSAVKSDFAPSLFLFADRTRQEEKTSFRDTDVTTDTYGLKASWNLFNGFSTYNTVRKYSAEENQSESQIRLKMADIRYQLRRAYIQCLISQRALTTWKRLLQLQIDQLSIVQIKYNKGVEALWSVEISKANVEVTKATIELELNNFSKARSNMEVLIGEPLPANIELVDDLDALLKTEVKGELSPNHPELTLLQQQVEEAGADTSIQRAGYLPSLKANLQWADAKIESQDTTHDNQLSLTLTFPLFEGFSTTNQTSKARAIVLAREYTLTDSRLRLEADVIQGRSLYSANLKFLKAKSSEVKATQLWSQTIEKQYRLGVRKYSDWDQAQTKMITSERDYLSSLRDTLESRILLEKTLAVTEEM